MIGFVGDICLANGTRELLAGYNEQSNSPVEDSQFSVANLECVFVNEGDLDLSTFNFCCPISRSKILAQLGINCVSLANNHVMDGGADGLATTVEALDKVGVHYFGAGKNLESACAAFTTCIDGKKFAFLGRMDTESFGDIKDTVATKDSAGVAPLDVDELIDTARRLRRENVDYVVLCVHWGTQELRRVSSRIQHKASAILVENNCIDLVVGHHSHCIQAADNVYGKHVFYGLGNYFFLPYRFNGRTLYDGSKAINSESLFVSAKEEQGQLVCNAVVVRQGVDTSLKRVSHSRELYLKKRIFGLWSSKSKLLYYLEYRYRGFLIELEKVLLLFESGEQRSKLYREIKNPKVLLRRIFDIIFNPRHR